MKVCASTIRTVLLLLSPSIPQYFGHSLFLPPVSIGRAQFQSASIRDSGRIFLSYLAHLSLFLRGILLFPDASPNSVPAVWQVIWMELSLGFLAFSLSWFFFFFFPSLGLKTCLKPFYSKKTSILSYQLPDVHPSTFLHLIP